MRRAARLGAWNAPRAAAAGEETVTSRKGWSHVGKGAEFEVLTSSSWESKFGNLEVAIVRIQAKLVEDEGRLAKPRRKGWPADNHQDGSE
ncbi:Spectrin Beta Chain, Non-Erythrocytic 2 [Manis pentadactyla]|nr:Spectrin Beta Chain, Non-Erythrocytic 2 [Manis pentadactyla]